MRVGGGVGGEETRVRRRSSEHTDHPPTRKLARLTSGSESFPRRPRGGSQQSVLLPGPLLRSDTGEAGGGGAAVKTVLSKTSLQVYLDLL